MISIDSLTKVDAEEDNMVLLAWKEEAKEFMRWTQGEEGIGGDKTVMTLKRNTEDQEEIKGEAVVQKEDMKRKMKYKLICERL